MPEKILQISPNKNRGYGFSPEETKKSVTPEDYIFGDGKLEKKVAGTQVIRPDGQYDDFLPVSEVQKFPKFDTYSCTVYGDENIIQTIAKVKYTFFEEYTERYLGVLSGIVNYSGGSPHTVFEKWRANGNLPYEKLPYEGIGSWNEFMSPKPMTQELIDEGRKWLKDWSLGHDWIWDFSHKNLMEALKYSPLGVGVYAWWDRGDGIYVNPGAQDNHWVMVYGYVEGKYWKVFDHYEVGGSVLKKLDWNYPFKFAKRASLERLTPFTDDDIEDIIIDKNMRFYKDIESPKIYLFGHDKRYHHLTSESLFVDIFGPFEENDIVEQIIPIDMIGSSVYDKKTLLNPLFEFFNSLGNKK